MSLLSAAARRGRAVRASARSSGLSLLGFFGGFFIVPIAALLQHRPDRAKKGEVLAAANLLSFVGIFAASGAYYLLADVAGLSRPGFFYLAAR